MIRIVIENILLFLLPTLLYVGYHWLRGREERKVKGRDSTAAILNDAPLIWLFVAGGVLVVATLVLFGSSSGGKPGQGYTPAILRDGKIEPGELK